MHLSPLDAAVIAVYFIVISSIAWHSRAPRDESSRDFMLGERKVPWWAAAMSIVGTEMSALTFVGVPGYAYVRTGKFSYLMGSVGMIVARIIVSRWFVPAYYRYNIISIYELLQKRFGPLTRNAAVAIFMFTRVAMSGVRLYAGSLVVEAALGISWQWAIVLTTFVGMIYTVVGGIKSVIWTEVLQVCVMFCGAFSAIYIIYQSLPAGWHSVAAATAGQGRFQIFDTRLDIFDPTQEFTVWAALIGMTFFNLSVFGTDYDMAQRMLTTKDAKRSARAVITSALADLPIQILFLSIGVLLYTFYHSVGEAGLPLKDGAVDADRVFTHFIVSYIPAGVRGLVMAGILSVALSSFQSALNALSTSFTVDVFKRYDSNERADGYYVTVTRMATVGFAALLMVVAFCSQRVDGLLMLGLKIPSYTYCALLGVFLVAIFSGRGSDRSCFAAMLLTTPFVLLGCHFWLGIAWTWNALFGTLFSVAVAVAFGGRSQWMEALPGSAATVAVSA